MLFAFLHPGIASYHVARPLIFLAKISYGLYLCHQFIFGMVDRHWILQPQNHFGLFPQLLLRFSVEASIAIAIAALSRYTFEAYFLRLKPQHPRTSLRHSAIKKIA